MRQASRQNRNSNLFRRIEYERACAQWRNRNTDSRLLGVTQCNGYGQLKRVQAAHRMNIGFNLMIRRIFFYQTGRVQG